jgi:hypothetical protein
VIFAQIRTYIYSVVLVALMFGSFFIGQRIERQSWQADALKAAESLRIIESQKDTRAHDIGVRSAAKQAAEVVYVDRLIKEIVAMPVSADCARLPDVFVELYNRSASGADQMPTSSSDRRADAGANRE